MATWLRVVMLSLLAGSLTVVACTSREEQLYDDVKKLCENAARDFATADDPFELAFAEMYGKKQGAESSVETLLKLRNEVSIKERWPRMVEAMGGRSPSSCSVIAAAWEKLAPTVELSEFRVLCEEAKKIGANSAIELFSKDPLDAATREIWNEVQSVSTSQRWSALVAALKEKGHEFSCPPLERYWSP